MVDEVVANPIWAAGAELETPMQQDLAPLAGDAEEARVFVHPPPPPPLPAPAAALPEGALVEFATGYRGVLSRDKVAVYLNAAPRPRPGHASTVFPGETCVGSSNSLPRRRSKSAASRSCSSASSS